MKGLRETLPFLTCVLIYTNLHDTIGFVNPHDVHHVLAALDRQIFGVVPAVWAERFITPFRTEVMSFFYANFFWIAPSTSLFLLRARGGASSGPPRSASCCASTSATCCTSLFPPLLRASCSCTSSAATCAATRISSPR